MKRRNNSRSAASLSSSSDVSRCSNGFDSGVGIPAVNFAYDGYADSAVSRRTLGESKLARHGKDQVPWSEKNLLSKLPRASRLVGGGPKRETISAR
jgi:hypothetical protein